MKPYSRYAHAQSKVDSLLEKIRERSRRILPENDLLLNGALSDLEDAMDELRAAHAEIDAQRENLDKAYQEVEREHQRYAELFESAPDGYIVTDLHGVIKQANRSVAELFESPREFIVGMPLVLFVDKEDENTYFRQLNAMAALETVRDWELRFQTRKGGSFWVSINISKVQISEQERFSLRWLIRDISRRKQVEETLQRYGLLAGHSRDIILFIRHDDRRIMEANAAAIKAYGYDYEELMKLTVQDLRAPFTQMLTSEEMAKAQTEGILFETVHRRKDGSMFPVEVSSRGEVIGDTRMLVSVVRDITERKRTQGIVHVSLTLQEFAASHSTEELLQKTLDEICRLINCPIGFFHFVENDQKDLSLHAWSTRTVEEFFSAGRTMEHFPVEKAGAWMDCLAQKRPVIHNDCSALPHQKALRDGHPLVIREMVVPIMRSGRVVAILGIGNKPEDYTQEDVEMVSRLADMAWEITGRKLAEEELKKSNQRLISTLESITDGFLSVDREWRITYCNKTGAEMLNRERKDLLGGLLWELFPEAISPKFYSSYLFAAESNTPVHFEACYPNSPNKWLECHAFPSSEGLSVYFRDISEHKLIEDTQIFLAQRGWMASGENFFESLARYLGQSLGMDFVCIDRLEGDKLSARTLAVYFDGKFEDNVTYTLKDTPCGDVVEKKICCFPEGVRDLFPLDEVLQEMKAESYVGTTLWSSRGQQIGLIAVIGRQPLTNPPMAESLLQLVAIRAAGELERMTTEKALRESEARFRTLFENMTEGVALHEMVYDENGLAVDYRIISTNPAFEVHTGLKREEVRGRLASELYGTYKAPFLEKYALVAESGQTVSFETFFQPIEQYFSVSVTSPKQGQFVTVFENITERKNMEEELRKSRDGLELRVQERTIELRISNKKLHEYTAKLERLNEELQEFVFVASHDLQEPLRKIQTFGHMLTGKSKAKLADGGQDLLTRIIGSANRMSGLLTSLLNYSRMVSIHTRFGPVDLAEAVRHAVGDLELTIKEAEATVEIGELPVIEADPSQMGQLFKNLIGNSIRYRKEAEKPSIKVYGHTRAGICKIFVEDNGIGFEEHYLDRIFKPFQQLHRRNSKYGGTGMGLAICRKIVQRHGGSITATSTPGMGSTFIIELPVKDMNGTDSR